jgi:hypothetical protein
MGAVSDDPRSGKPLEGGAWRINLALLQAKGAGRLKGVAYTVCDRKAVGVSVLRWRCVGGSDNDVR